jgi:hypothetical protein
MTIGERPIRVLTSAAQESQDLTTQCGNLIPPAKQVSNTCQIDNLYTYGYVARSLVVGSQSYPYLVAIGDGYAFAP